MLLHNLRFDEPVAEFANASGVGAAASAGGKARGAPHGAGGGACTAISFRTGAHKSAERQEKQEQACLGQYGLYQILTCGHNPCLSACSFVSSITWFPSMLLFLWIIVGF